MKRTVLIFTTTMAFVAGLLVGGQVLGAGHEQMGQTQMGGSSMGQEAQMHQSRVAAADLNREQIREMQNLLNERGYNVGQADGFIGPRTREGLRQFQSSEGLAATGTPDRETLRALAPSAEKQQFFGLSPEYGEMKQMMETRPAIIPEKTEGGGD
ncbi:MAG: peptidoglycan-binding protein [Deltaproteobacteria bacterium]|nr:peptidoglycan-binding protein [Deltaproteobacteria bacterium]